MVFSRYKIQILPETTMDIDDVYYYIAYNKFLPDTARKYRQGIYETIEKIAWLGDKIGVSLNENLQQKYGYGVKTMIYKKMTIIYNVMDDHVFVRRVKPGGSIK